MRTPTRTLAAATTAAALILPVLPAGASDGATVDAAARLDRVLQIRAETAVGLTHLDPADAALLRRAQRAHDVLYRLRDGDRPATDPPGDRPASDRAPGATGDRTDRPTDATRDRADRPTDRRTDDRTDRPTDEAPHREETFRVGDAGAVTLAWNRHGIRILEVHTAEGWRSQVRHHEPRSVAVGFTDGEVGLLFWARLTPDGLRHGVERRRIDGDRDVRTYEVLDAGTVAIAVTDEGLRLAGVREREGWVSRHEAERRRVHVVFLNREERRRVDFVAELTAEGEVVTHIRETTFDEDPTAPSTDVRPGGADATP